MENKLLGTMIVVVVGVLMVGTLLVPVINSDNFSDIVYNTSGYSASIVDSSDDSEMTMTYDGTAHELYVNGVKCTYAINEVALMSDDVLFTVTTISPFSTFVYQTDDDSQRVLISNPKSASISASGGVMTVSIVQSDDTSVEKTFDYNWLAYRDNAGTDRIGGVVTAPKTVYYSENNPVYIVRTMTVDSTSQLVTGVGDTVKVGNGETYTGTVAFDGTEYANGVYSATINFNSGDCTITVGDETSYPMYIAYSGSVDASSTEQNQYKELLSVIPVVLIIALIVLVARPMLKRD